MRNTTNNYSAFVPFFDHDKTDASATVSPEMRSAVNSTYLAARLKKELPYLVENYLLGSGAYGAVYDGTLHFSSGFSASVVSKRMKKGIFKNAKEIKEVFQSEYQAHEALTQNATTEQSGILKLIGILGGSIILPKCEMILGVVLPLVREQSGALQASFFMHFLGCMLKALTTLSNQKRVHRDIKPLNVGFRNGVWCIFDLGVSKTYQAIIDHPEELGGTLQYVPVETTVDVAEERGLVDKIDIYSLGIMLTELFVALKKDIREPVLQFKSMSTLYESAKQYDASYGHEVLSTIDGSLFADNFDSQRRHFISRMTEILPKHRATLLELMALFNQLQNSFEEQYPNFDPKKLTDFFEELESFQLSHLNTKTLLRDDRSTLGRLAESVSIDRPPVNGRTAFFVASQTAKSVQSSTTATPVVTPVTRTPLFSALTTPEKPVVEPRLSALSCKDTQKKPRSFVSGVPFFPMPESDASSEPTSLISLQG